MSGASDSTTWFLGLPHEQSAEHYLGKSSAEYLARATEVLEHPELLEQLPGQEVVRALLTVATEVDAPLLSPAIATAAKRRFISAIPGFLESAACPAHDDEGICLYFWDLLIGRDTAPEMAWFRQADLEETLVGALARLLRSSVEAIQLGAIQGLSLMATPAAMHALSQARTECATASDEVRVRLEDALQQLGEQLH